LWFFYDDMKDHLIVVDKQDWDCLNRVLLLLSSNSELTYERKWFTWRGRQAVAAAGLLSYGYLAYRGRFAAETLVLLAIPFWLASMALAWFNTRHPLQRRDYSLEPFPSISSLRTVRRGVDNFVRKRYPPGLAGRRLRGRGTSALMWFPTILMWLAFAPFVLLFQMVPERDLRITISDSTTGSVEKPA